MTATQILFSLIGAETLLIVLVAFAINLSVTRLRKKVDNLEETLQTLVEAVREMRKAEKGEP